MSRIVRIDGPGKTRNQLMRTAAEVIYRLGRKSEVDEDVQDMVASLVYCFRQIDATVEEATLAWERRNYWIKVERFKARWAWAGQAAERLDKIVQDNDWDVLPTTLVELMPHFEEIKVARLTRSPSVWRGAYQCLLQEHATSEKV